MFKAHVEKQLPNANIIHINFNLPEYPKMLIARTRQADYQYEGILVTDVASWLSR